MAADQSPWWDAITEGYPAHLPSLTAPEHLAVRYRSHNILYYTMNLFHSANLFMSPFSAFYNF